MENNKKRQSDANQEKYYNFQKIGHFTSNYFETL